MRRAVIDAPVALRLVTEESSVAAQLVAPALLKSHVLQLVHAQTRAGRLERGEARVLLDSFATLTVRYLSDRVSRQVAFEIAREMDDGETALAEYLAVTRLQADAFVTLDDDVARRAAAVVPVASYDDLIGA